jgi:hypothetical protein
MELWGTKLTIEKLPFSSCIEFIFAMLVLKMDKIGKRG